MRTRAPAEEQPHSGALTVEVRRAALRRWSGWAAACVLSTAAAAPLEGSALQRALEGLWCNSPDGGRTCWAYDVFTADGHFEACGRQEDERQPFKGTGRVSVEGRRMCYVVLTASTNFWLRPGQRYCTDILDIDASMHRYRDIDTGQEFVLWRRSPGPKACP